MNTLKKISLLLLVLSVTTGLIKGADKSDATLRLSGRAVAAGIGVSWGEGTLKYKGKSYSVSVNGLSVAKVGISKTTASGQVYNLKKLEDFNGNYTARGGGGRGVTIAGGGSAVTIENQNGVRVMLSSTTQGADLTVGRGGIKMEIKK